MNPGLANLRVERESGSTSGQSVALEHSGFSEIRAEGRSIHEACERLRQEFNESLDWVSDDWHTRDLDQAIEDLEAFTSLSTSEGSATTAFEDRVFLKIWDIIYQVPVDLYYGDSDCTSGVTREDSSPDTGQNEGIIIYAVGQRVCDRRESEHDAESEPERSERRESDRRQSPRRNYGRFLPVDNPPIPERDCAAPGR